MEAKEEKKSNSPWCEWAVISLIALTIVFSGVWLYKMSDVLKSQPGHVEVRHVYANFESETKRDKNEETQYTLYKQAEETLREQMNTWLTIVGFFGVLFGLIVPLASYLLQRRSLSEERERIMEGVKKEASDAAEKAAEKASKEAADAKTAAEAASKAAENDAAEAKKAAGDATKDASDAKDAAGKAAGEAKNALDNVKAAKEELQKQLEEAIKEIGKVSRKAQEAMTAADKAQEMAKEASKDRQKGLETATRGGGAQDVVESEIEKTRQKAEQGDRDAQNSLGYWYQYGLGVEKDEFEAVYWYRKAAKQGLPVAQYNLGLMYRFGRGVDKNDTEAVCWYRKAAGQGHADAENNLGVMLEYGLGCEENEQEALEWYRKAAEHGSGMGRKNLGVIYEKGLLGVKADLAKAKELYQQVIDDPNAGENPKKLAQEGLDRIAKLEGGK